MRARLVLFACVLPLVGCQIVFGYEAFDEVGANAFGGAAGAGGTLAGSGGEGGAAGESLGGTGGTGGVDGEAGTGGASGQGGEPTSGGRAGSNACEGNASPGIAERGPSMLPVPLPNGACAFVDSTEVTQKQYAAFRKDAKPGDQPASLCKTLNLTYEPDASCLSKATSAGDEQPQVCVDLCDAGAFCRWAGKELCRADEGIVANIGGPADPWYHACAGPSDRSYPYGHSFDSETCNVSSKGVGATLPVSSLTGCVSERGIFDLSGNVAEWTEECSGTNASDKCTVRGGSFADSQSAARCTSRVAAMSRDQADEKVGFRCCVVFP